MVLENKLGITDSSELAREEEKISKKKALELFESGFLNNLEAGTIDSLRKIHKFLFDEIYYFAGEIRNVNIAKGNFRFAPVMYLEQALKHIDEMPQSTYDEIIEKYVEMNVAHPFREGNGRSTRIWLDMERSPIKNVEIRELLKPALTSEINDREVYIKGIDASYNYEGYFTFKTRDLC